MSNNGNFCFLGINVIFSGIYFSVMSNSVLVGLMAAILLFVLLLIPIIQYIVQVIFGIMWGELFFDLASLFLHSSGEKIVGHIICIVIGVAINIGELFLINQNAGIDIIKNQKATNEVPQRNLYIISTNAILKFNSLIETQNMIHRAMEEIFRPYNITLIENDYKQYCIRTNDIIRLIKHYLDGYYQQTYYQVKDAYLNSAISNINSFEKIQSDFIYSLHNHQRVINEFQRNNAGRTHINNSKKENNNIYINMFNGCSNIEELNKRYRDLMKLYHPDNKSGDTNMTVNIKDAYEHLKKDYK